MRSTRRKDDWRWCGRGHKLMRVCVCVGSAAAAASVAVAISLHLFCSYQNQFFF